MFNTTLNNNTKNSLLMKSTDDESLFKKIPYYEVETFQRENKILQIQLMPDEEFYGKSYMVEYLPKSKKSEIDENERKAA